MISSDMKDMIKAGVTNNRSGKGSSYVKQAGDNYTVCDNLSAGYLVSSICLSHDSIADTGHELHQFITVGAYDAKGDKTADSSTGVYRHPLAFSSGRNS